MQKTYDVIVLGVGSMGAAACYHLAKRGCSVLGLEQHEIPHGLGAHHGFSRMIRLAYYEHPDYVPLLKRAYELWGELENGFGERLLHITGGLYLAARDGAFMHGVLGSAHRHDLNHSLLDRKAVESRHPAFRMQEDYQGFFEEQAGFLVPEKVMAAHVLGALRHGAELRAHHPVIAWEASAGDVTVTTKEDAFRARHLVVTAGAWTSKVLADLKPPLTVTRQTWGWFWPKEPDRFALGVFPCWFYERQAGGGFYGFPMMPENPGLKLALHHPGQPTSPDEVIRRPLPEDEVTLRQFLDRHLPDASGNLLAIRTCLYTNTPDGHFIIDHHPQHGSAVTIACGFSGHGFKFASVIGEILADISTHGSTNHPVEFLRLSRFNVVR